jgi:hypothetical protein
MKINDGLDAESIAEFFFLDGPFYIPSDEERTEVVLWADVLPLLQRLKVIITTVESMNALEGYR